QKIKLTPFIPRAKARGFLARNGIKIAARVNDSKLVPKFKTAGANYIILPEAIGGIKLADALRGKVDSAHVFVN
ncbi:MAG: hypothetical protein V1839_00770, partial [archaeon]